MRQLPGSDAIFLSLARQCAERLALTPKFVSKLREVPFGLDRATPLRPTRTKENRS